MTLSSTENIEMTFTTDSDPKDVAARLEQRGWDITAIDGNSINLHCAPWQGEALVKDYCDIAGIKL